jgi:hypothetical protein
MASLWKMIFLGLTIYLRYFSSNHSIIGGDLNYTTSCTEIWGPLRCDEDGTIGSTRKGKKNDGRGGGQMETKNIVSWLVKGYFNSCFSIIKLSR